MLTKIKKELRFNFSNFWQSAAIIGGIWLISYIFCSIIMVAKHPDTYTNIAVMFTLILGTMYMLLLFATSFAIEFELAIKMSITRKTALILKGAVMLLHCVMFAFLVIIFAVIDKALTHVFFGNVKYAEMSITVSFTTFGIAIAAAVCALIGGMFVGTLLQKYGKIAFWILWGIYMFLAFCGMGFGMAADNKNSLIGRVVNYVSEFMSTVTLQGMTIFGILIALIVFAISVILLRRTTIKS